MLSEIIGSVTSHQLIDHIWCCDYKTSYTC